MHKFKKLNCAPSSHFTNIVDSKTGDIRTTLDSISKKVMKRYAAFEAKYSVDLLDSIPMITWSVNEEDALLHCYSTSVTALSSLKRKIKEFQDEGVRDVCPSCGIGRPRQFDHYLPKDQFPELSVHSHNLIPICGLCNGIKSNIWLDNGLRVFINSYVDALPSAPFLSADVQWAIRKGKLVPKVEYTLQRPPYFSNEKYRLLESHATRLNLVDRYRDESHSEYIALRDAAIAREATSLKQLRKFLTKYLSQRQATLGPLNWRLVLYSKLIEHDPFLKACL